jgi:hypothetical protein
VYPGLPAVRGVRRDESRSPHRIAHAVLPASRRGRRGQRGRASPLLRRVQRGDGPARRSTTWRPSSACSRSTCCRGQARRRGRARAPELIKDRRSSPSRASSTTSPATARPRRHTGCARAFPRKNRQHYLAPGVGHYGIFSGRKYREMIYPRIRAFIQAYSR